MSSNTSTTDDKPKLPLPGPTGSAWHDVPTCAGWWWSNVMEQWSEWLSAAPRDRVIADAGPWWGPWKPNEKLSDWPTPASAQPKKEQP
jgi:hypothetical protein